VNECCTGCFTHLLHTAAFHEDIKPAVPQIVKMLKDSDSSVQSLAQNVLTKLMEQRKWWVNNVQDILLTLCT
jgi:hypothetical protein